MTQGIKRTKEQCEAVAYELSRVVIAAELADLDRDQILDGMISAAGMWLKASTLPVKPDGSVTTQFN